MGLRSAAMACQRITSAVCFICDAEGHHTLSYLDDFIGVAPPDTAWQAYEHCARGLVSKETVVLRRWERETQNFGFVNLVDKVNWPP